VSFAAPLALLGLLAIPVLVGVWPLRSHSMALRLHNEVPGISVPKAVLDALVGFGLPVRGTTRSSAGATGKVLLN